MCVCVCVCVCVCTQGIISYNTHMLSFNKFSIDVAQGKM